MLAATAASPTMRVERLDTVIIGAGQAGLAVGQQLATRDADFVIVDGAARVGDSWRGRWDSLRLFTPARYSGLPGMPFPAPPSHLPDKDEVADYLERYAERFDLPVRLGSPVTSLRREDGRFVVRAGSSLLEADNVVVATGPFHRPFVPPTAARLSPAIRQLHSAQYTNPLDLGPGPVLVVGAGNSGAQVALELAQSRKVWLSGRNTGHLPRNLLGRDLFDWLWPVITAATMHTALGQRLRRRGLRGGDTVIGIPERALVAVGIQRVGRVVDERGGLPVCDGRVLEPRVIVWSTGFSPCYSWIDLPVVGPDALPRHDRGVSADIDGLYFVGQRFQHRASSSLIGGVGADATFVADRIAARLACAEADLEGVATSP